ncbi:MAG: CopD family protein [Rhodospirillales bacterium]|jgi:uncharacterized membrane protein|nr:CopD family protein [Rhodospirillales bacterium]
MSAVSSVITNPWGWVLALHLLCAAAWVGGMFFALAVVRPSLAVLEPPQRVALHHRIFRRFFLVIWFAMPLILLSGYAMVFGFYGGFRHLPWNVNAMQGIGLLMAAIFLAIVFGPYRRFRAAVGTARALEAAEKVRKLILANLLLGALVIILAAL